MHLKGTRYYVFDSQGDPGPPGPQGLPGPIGLDVSVMPSLQIIT